MAFNIFKWLFGKTEEPAPATTDGKARIKSFLDEDLGEYYEGMEVYVQRMIFWAIVRKIGSAVGAAEWKTYRRGKAVQSNEYWAWNYSPNENESRREFMMKLVGQLYQHQEALIVEDRNGDRFVADGFSTTQQLSGDMYSDISARGFSIPGRFKAEDVLHLTIEGDSARAILAGIGAVEGKLMKSAASAYVRQQGRRGILTIEELAEASDNFEEELDDLMNDKFKKYFTAENAVLPLYQGYSYEEKESGGGSTKSTLAGTRDIRNMMDDIIEFTATSMGIPLSVATGKGVTDADFKEFMTTTVKPLTDAIETEINRKIYGKDRVLAGTYVKASLDGVRYTDLFDVAGPIDKLIGSGSFCINDIRVRLGLEVIDEEWAWQHWMTKNYATMGELNENLGAKEGNPNEE